MRFQFVAVALLVASSVTQAQLPAARPLGRVEAASRDSFCSSVEVRPLSDGRVVVHDPVHRRVVLLDAGLQSTLVLFDQTTPLPLTYPRGSARMLAGRGDTTLLVDPQARGFRVIDPSGTVVRRLSLYNPVDIDAMAGPLPGASFDPLGRIVFAEALSPTVVRTGKAEVQRISGLGIIRVGLDKPGRDTLASIVRASEKMQVVGSGLLDIPPTRTWATTRAVSETMQMFDAGDDWVITPDGVLAIVVAADYHVDWYELDGTRRQTPPVGWPWKMLSAEEKQQLADSAQRITSELAVQRGSPGYCPPPPPPIGFSWGPPSISTDVSDTLPAFVHLHTRADPKGRIWVLEGPSMIGRTVTHPIYDIIDRSGRIIDRVQLPDRRTVTAFGPRGEVYLLAANGSTISIERADPPPH